MTSPPHPSSAVTLRLNPRDEPPVSEIDTESRATTLGEGRLLDWRTIPPSEIQGESIPRVELVYFREIIEDLLNSVPGRYVLIVGREVVSNFPDLDEAAGFAGEHFEGKPVLIKKVAAIEPIHTIGGVIG